MLHGTWLWAVRVATGVQRNRSAPDARPLARRVVTVDVEHDFVGVDVVVVVRDRHRERVVVGLTRNEVADHKVVALKHLMHRRWLVHTSGDRFEIRDVEHIGIQAAIPAHDIERMLVGHVDRPAQTTGARPSVLDVDLGATLGKQGCRGRTQISLAVGRVLEQLAEARQVPKRRRDVRVGLDHIGAQRFVAGRQPAVRRRPRHYDVVATADVEGSEYRLNRGRAVFDVHALVAHGVAVQRRRLRRNRVRDADIGIAQHQPATGDRVGSFVVIADEQVVQPQVPWDERAVRGRR